MIDGDNEALLYGSIVDEAERLGCVVIAAGGVADHVHLLVQIPATLSVADVAKHVKGASAFVMNKAAQAQHFKWQGSYSAFSVSRWDLREVGDYICNQKQNHTNGTTKPALEQTI